MSPNPEVLIEARWTWTHRLCLYRHKQQKKYNHTDCVSAGRVQTEVETQDWILLETVFGILLYLKLNQFTTRCCSWMLNVSYWFDPAGLLLGWNINLDSRGNQTNGLIWRIILAWWLSDYKISIWFSEASENQIKMHRCLWKCRFVTVIVKVWFVSFALIIWWDFDHLLLTRGVPWIQRRLQI